MFPKCPDHLENATIETAPLFTLDKLVAPAKIYRVYDGDSAYMAIDLHERLHSFKVRLRNIDTPELRSKDATEKTLAIQARDRLRTLVDGKICLVKCHKFDKYGRCLVDIFNRDGTNVGLQLIDECLAYPYDGGQKRKTWNALFEDRKRYIHSTVTLPRRTVPDTLLL